MKKIVAAFAALAVSASAHAANTSHFDLLPAEKESAASWVLSPSSATKTEPKIEKNSFQSMAASLVQFGHSRTPTAW